MTTATIALAIAFVAPELPKDTVETYASLVRRYAEVSKIDPLLVVALVDNESQWNWRAENPTSHARGLMQIMPVHWAEDKDARPLVTKKRILPYQPQWNIRRGCELLRWYLSREDCGGDTRKAICGYNGLRCKECKSRFVDAVLKLYQTLHERKEKAQS